MYVLTSSATFVGAAADIGFVPGNLGTDMYLSHLFMSSLRCNWETGG